MACKCSFSGGLRHLNRNFGVLASVPVGHMLWWFLIYCNEKQ